MSEQTKSKPGNIVPADMLHHRAACQLEQAISMARVPKHRANAEKNLASCGPLQWKGLSDNYKKVPLYRASQAKACILLGALRADDKHLDEAEAEFKTGVGLLEQLIKDFGGVPSYYSELGRTQFRSHSLRRMLKHARITKPSGRRFKPGNRIVARQCPRHQNTQGTTRQSLIFLLR